MGPDEAAAPIPRVLRDDFRSAGFTAIGQRCQSDLPYRAVAPKGMDRLLPLYNRADWLWEKIGLGRWFGTPSWSPGGASRDGETPPLLGQYVVPVFHESETIGPFCCAVGASFPSPGYELLVCYDTPEDSHPAGTGSPWPDEENRRTVVPPSTATLSRGVRYAIEAGFRGAAPGRRSSPWSDLLGRLLVIVDKR